MFVTLYTREAPCGILQTMKTILITAGEDIILRNILQTDFFPGLARLLPDARFVIAVDPKKMTVLEPKFKSAKTSLVGFVRGDTSFYEGLVMTLARSGIKSKTNLWSKMRSYERGHSGFIPTYFKRAHTALLGDSSGYKRFLRRLILALPSDAPAQKLFDAVKPDVLLSLSLTNFDFDIPIAREARKRGIPILGMARSWDNFSSHGLLRVIPNRLYLQNIFLKDMAARYQALTERDVPMTIVGLPHYDAYAYACADTISRERFCELYGLDPKKKIILYGAMGDFLFPNEPGMADVLERIIKEGKIGMPTQALYRVHPKFQSALEQVEKMKYVKAMKPDSYVTHNTASGISNEALYLAALCHADVVVSGASTVAIDATVVGKRVICVAFDGTTPEHKVKYWHSVKRFYDSYTHFEALMDTGAILRADTPDMLAEEINKCLKYPTPDTVARKRALDIFVEPFGGAGRRLAQAIGEDIIHHFT